MVRKCPQYHNDELLPETTSRTSALLLGKGNAPGPQHQLALIYSLCLSAYGGIVDDIIDAIKHAATCNGCHTLLGLLSGLAYSGDSTFSSTMATACKRLHAQDDDVCDGVMSQQGPILAHDLRAISLFSQTSTKLCNALVGLCENPAVNKYRVPFPKPAPAHPRVFTSRGRLPIKVVHFSDVHIDRSYTTGSEANCTKPICCRRFPDQTGSVHVAAGPLGSHGCDAPASLAQSMLLAIAGENTKFSIFTGDVVEVALWDIDKAEATSDLKEFNRELSSLLRSPIFPVIGNHDVTPVNSFPRNTTKGQSSQWVYNTQSSGWASLIGANAANQVKGDSGSYASVVPGTKLRIISLNTIYWYKLNFWLFDTNATQPDPNGVLSFMVRQLQEAEDAGQRAWIIGHMPPSSGDALYDQSNYFDQIVQRYKNTVAGQFYGHSHQDEFAIAYEDYKRQTAETADSIAWIVPSLTPRQSDPAFRVYDVDPDTYEVMDSRTFISDMSDPNFQVFPVWKQEYSARATYGPAIGGWPSDKPLNPAFWHKVTEAFEKHDTLFQKFHTLKTPGGKITPCEGDCKKETICNMRAMRAENGCHPAKPGFNFERRADNNSTLGHSHLDNHCEGFGLSHIFMQMMTEAQKIST
ncbi:unnamed protein product [Cyclocybe aegerita]|uniref:Sphingomyelin phosphodiesterase n=1 Tax=Cyclocybe aegerita TaxID=1973307 RepID=A0A8S0XQ09_CYCAE|nr:unnamed protein product [Cyclocybe aegerita]